MIKRSPADFHVEELLGPEIQSLTTTAPPAEKGFALYRLEKESLATPEAVGRAARTLNVRSGAFAYAGLKDKHASTIQYVTLKLEAETPAPERHAGDGFTLTRLGFVPRPITASDIHRNRFRIAIRNLNARDSKDIDEAARLLTVGGSLRIINYFGDQRFGSARHGQGFLAKHLIKGEFEEALMLAIATEARKDRMEQKVFKRTLREMWGEWKEALKKLRPCPERKAIERLANSGGDFRAAFCALPYLLQQLSVYAYQSHLWNAVARKLVETACTPLGQVIAADDPFGEMLFPTVAATPPELTDVTLPLFAKKTELVAPWKDAAEGVLKDEGIAVADLHIPGVRRPFFGEEPRQLFFLAEDFQLSKAEKDESADDRKRVKRTLAFSLPRGCYATVLLRALGQ